MPKAAAAMSIQHWVNKSRRRRSTTSANAPAANDRRNTGKLEAASTRETSRGEVESDVINQSAPTSCIQVPRLEASEPSHKARKSGCRRGSQPDGKRSRHFVVSGTTPIPLFDELSQVIASEFLDSNRANQPAGRSESLHHDQARVSLRR